MEYQVHMLAYQPEYCIRVVSVPEHVVQESSDEEILEKIFYYGQNDFQLQNMCSVSMGDVIEYEEKLYVVCCIGFRQISKEQFEEYKAMERRDRQFSNLIW